MIIMLFIISIILLIGLIVLVIILGKDFCAIINRYLKQQDTKFFYSVYNSKEDIYNKLDAYIYEIFAQYQIEDQDAFDKPTINSDAEDKMIKKLASMCMIYMPNTLYTVLSLYINKAFITEVVTKRASMVIISYCSELSIQFNADKLEKEEQTTNVLNLLDDDNLKFDETVRF